MKGLPEHIKDVDGFYKAKSEDDFMPELPEDLWEDIASHIPSSPLPNLSASTPTVEKGSAVTKGVNLYHAGLFYASGLVSAVLFYTAYVHFTHQEDIATIQIALPSSREPQKVDSISAGASLDTERGLSNEKSSISTHTTSKESKTFPTSFSQEAKSDFLKEGAKEVATTSSTAPLPEGTNQANEQKEKPELLESKPTPSTSDQEELVDFYHKHSKNAKDSLSKQLFIPKR